VEKTKLEVQSEDRYQFLVNQELVDFIAHLKKEEIESLAKAHMDKLEKVISKHKEDIEINQEEEEAKQVG
jgi:hypothetical protein